MKRNIAIGIFLISALVLSSCSTQKLATVATNDDVYFSNAKAGDEPIYAATAVYDQNSSDYQQPQQEEDDDDYFYYDDYASRINRFSYYSPFSYYDNLYYGYSNPYYNSGWNLGFNYGPYGYGYSPYGYGSYGYGGWGLGYGIGYGFGGWGLGYGYGYGGYGGYDGYGNGGYGGGYGYASNGTPRPVRGTGAPLSNRGTGAIGTRTNTTYNNGNVYNGVGRRNGNSSPATTGIGYIPGGRPTRNTDGTVSSRNNASNNNSSDARPVRQQDSRPAVQQVDRTPSPQPSSSSSSGSRSSGGSSSGGGGGGRPSRP